MSGFGGLARFEITRVVLSRRWLAAAIAWGAAALLASDEVSWQAQTYATGWAALDTHAAAANNGFFVGLLLLTAFVLTVGDALARDRETRFAHTVLTRTGSRRVWWLAKVTALLTAAAMFQAGFLLTCYAVGLYQGGEPGGTPSPVALLTASSGSDVAAQPLFTPATPGANMWLREAGVAVYLAIGFTALALVLLAITVKVPRSFVPGLLCLGFALADLALGWFISAEWFSWVSPLSHLLEAMHSSAVVESPLPWAASIALWLAMGGGAIAAGSWLVVRADL